MIDFSELSLETFQVLRAYGKEIVLFDENGNRVFEPADARRFYLSSDNILVSILDDGDNSAIKTYLSTNIQIAEVLEFITVLRRIATQFNVLFNVRKYNKKITPRDFATQAAVQEQKEYSMNIMEGLYGTSKSSYLKLENARMIVRHSARVKENMIGGRGRAIQSIFVENAKGERFLFPVNVLSGARAMTQHVNHGGTFADAVGQQIIRMAQDFSNLSTVANHIGTNAKVLSAEAAGLRESIRTKGMEIRRTFERMCRDETSYIRESARITEAEALTESPDNLAETIEAIRSVIAVEGVSFEDTVLETVAKRVGFSEDMRPDQNAPDNTQDPDDGKPAQPVQPTKPVAPGQNNDQNGDDQNGQDNDEEQENGSFHEDVDVAETAAVRAFDAWMEDFDPDFFFSEGKSFKRNDDDDDCSADEKKKQDKERRDSKRSRDDQVEESQALVNEATVRVVMIFPMESGVETEVGLQQLDAVVRRMAAEQGIKLVGRMFARRAAAVEGYYTNKREANLIVAAAKELGFEYGGLSYKTGGIGLGEGKSFKRNKDEDADDKKKQDKQRREERDSKQRTDEGILDQISDEFETDEDWAYDHQDELVMAIQTCVDTARQNPALMPQMARLVKKGLRALYMTGFSPMDVVDLDDPAVQAMGIAESLEEGKSFKRNKDEDADEKKKQDKQRRDDQRGKQERTDEAQEGSWEVHGVKGVKSTPFHKTFKSEAARTAWLEKNDGDVDVHGFRDPEDVSEGKSFKRNKDEDADDKKKQDKQKRDSSKNKQTPVVESHNDKFAVFGLLSENGRRFSRSFVTAEDRATWLAVNEGVVVHGFADPLVEGKSFKRNDDEDAKSKKQKDDERRQARDDKKKPVEEGKSFKRNDDDEEDVKDKKKQDKQRREEREDKKRTDEAGIQSPFDFLHDPTLLKGKPAKAAFDAKMAQTAFARGFRGSFGGFGGEDTGIGEAARPFFTIGMAKGAAARKEIGPALIPAARIRTSWGDAKANPAFVKLAKTQAAAAWQSAEVQELLNGANLSEASDISFNDAKAEYKTVKNQLAKMSPFDKNYVSTKAHLGKLEDRLKRADQDELDEASDISFQDAKAELPHVKDKLGKMSPFDKEYISTKARHDKLKDRLSRMQDDEVDESMGGPGYVDQSGANTDAGACNEAEGDDLYGGMPADEFHNWIDYGNPVRFKPGTGYERPGVWNPSQLNVNANRCWVGDADNRGWYVSLDHLVPHHEGDEEETDESYVSGDGGYGGDSSDVIESANAKNPTLNESGVFDLQKYLKSIR